MGFRELLNRAKTMDDTAMVQIIELYNRYYINTQT